MSIVLSRVWERLSLAEFIRGPVQLIVEVCVCGEGFSNQAVLQTRDPQGRGKWKLRASFTEFVSLPLQTLLEPLPTSGLRPRWLFLYSC